ncbi:hypothetical protein [Actinophytocola sp.]|uniref:hypothetical protein n=1 Tax=Actinophytocola sp. TaxID=1872138 RepID=UPI00389A3ADC
MTGLDDELTSALTRTLRHHAEDAPAVNGLPEKAIAIAGRRRRRRINASIAAIVALAVGIPVAIVATVHGTSPTADDPNPGWRWESYRGVQVQVPPDWGEGAPRSDWCAATPDGQARRATPPGAVGRPRMILAIGCPSEYPPADQRTSSLYFDTRNKAGVRGFDHGWVEETRRVDDVFITVFSPDGALRAAIFGSARPIVGLDRYGCPTDHPVAADPDGYRPDPAVGGLPPADTVMAISVCRYTLKSDPAPPLLSSGRITGRSAQGAVAAIRSAPKGRGPDVDNGRPEARGSEIVVLRIDTTDVTREVVVHYSGELGNGFDDGKTTRELTADALRSLLTGANRPQAFYLPVAGLMPR